MLRPGVTHRYSKVGYAVLERIIERVSGLSYREFLRRALFIPLGMSSADVITEPTDPPGVAIPYTRAGGRYPAYDMDTRGAGGLIMTATDLVRFGRFFSDALDGKSELLSRQAASTMLQMQSPDQRGALEYYVLGWVHELRGLDREHDTIYHLGSTPGARAELWIYPARNLVVATLLNEMRYAVAPIRVRRPYGPRGGARWHAPACTQLSHWQGWPLSNRDFGRTASHEGCWPAAVYPRVRPRTHRRGPTGLRLGKPNCDAKPRQRQLRLLDSAAPNHHGLSVDGLSNSSLPSGSEARCPRKRQEKPKNGRCSKQAACLVS